MQTSIRAYLFVGLIVIGELIAVAAFRQRKMQGLANASQHSEMKKAKAQVDIAAEAGVFHTAQAERLERGWKAHGVQYAGYQTISFTNLMRHQFELLEAFATSLEGVELLTDEQPEMMVSPSMLEITRSWMTNMSIDFLVGEGDVGQAIEEEHASNIKAFKLSAASDIVGRYPSVEELDSWLKLMVSRHPEASLFRVGTSVEGRPITGITIKKREGLPVMYLQSALHAREWITLGANVWYINRLLTGNVSDEMWLTEQLEWRIVPLVNPDGYVWSYTKDRMWRKNRGTRLSKWCPRTHEADRHSHVGVDLNRNWDTQGWTEGIGMNKDPCTQSWGGLRPFDQPETKAISDYLLANKGQIRSFIDLHAFSQMWLYPPALVKLEVPDRTWFHDVKRAGDEAARRTQKVHRQRYKAGTPTALLPYLKPLGTAGSSFDWTFDPIRGPGIKYSYASELRPGQRAGWNGFTAKASEIKPAAEEYWEGIKHIAEVVVAEASA